MLLAGVGRSGRLPDAVALPAILLSCFAADGWCAVLVAGEGVGGRACEGSRTEERDWAATAFMSCEHGGS